MKSSPAFCASHTLTYGLRHICRVRWPAASLLPLRKRGSWNVGVRVEIKCFPTIVVPFDAHARSAITSIISMLSGNPSFSLVAELLQAINRLLREDFLKVDAQRGNRGSIEEGSEITVDRSWPYISQAVVQHEARMAFKAIDGK